MLKNKCLFVGQVGAIDYRKLPNDAKVCRLELSVSETFKDANGQRKENNETIPLQAWGTMADWIKQNVRSGDTIHVDTSMRTERRETSSGDERTRVVFRVNHVDVLVRNKQN